MSTLTKIRKKSVQYLGFASKAKMIINEAFRQRYFFKKNPINFIQSSKIFALFSLISPTVRWTIPYGNFKAIKLLSNILKNVMYFRRLFIILLCTEKQENKMYVDFSDNVCRSQIKFWVLKISIKYCVFKSKVFIFCTQ